MQFFQTCIPKKTIFNASKAFGDSVMGRAGEDEPWICPSHFCVLCKALSTGNGMQELSDLSIPSYLKLNGDHIQRKPLSSCLKCPMSICLDCERDLGSGIPVILLGERAQSGEAGVSASCGVIPVNLAKLSDNYDPTADVFAIYPIENETSSSFNPFKTFSSKQQGELVISALVNRIELPTIIRGTDGNSGSAEDEGLLLLGGRTARRRGVVNYSDNTPKKVMSPHLLNHLYLFCLVAYRCLDKRAMWT